MVEEDPTPASPLAEGDRRDLERLEAFVRGAPRIPPHFTLWLLGAFVVLGLGGVALDHGFSALGLNPTAPPATSRSPTSLAAAGASPAASGQSPTSVSATIAASDSALMGLSPLGGRAAPPVALSTSRGPMDLQQYRGMVVVISFFDATCDDICHVLAAEMAQADADMGSSGQHVAFLAVNTDPLSTDRWPAPSQVFAGLTPPANWTFATGTLSALNRVWAAYGVTVDVTRSSGSVRHNDVLYFVDPNGRLSYLTTPFANQVSAGRYTLPASEIARWGHGMAELATGLLR